MLKSKAKKCKKKCERHKGQKGHLTHLNYISTHKEHQFSIFSSKMLKSRFCVSVEVWTTQKVKKLKILAAADANKLR